MIGNLTKFPNLIEVCEACGFVVSVRLSAACLPFKLDVGDFCRGGGGLLADTLMLTDWQMLTEINYLLFAKALLGLGFIYKERAVSPHARPAVS